MKEWLTLRNGIGCVLVGLFFVTAGRSLGGGYPGLGPALISISFLITAAIFFSESLSDFLARPFARFIDSIYFGNDDREPPPLNLRLAEAYRQERRFDEALAECERQLEYHRHSPALWSEMIVIARESGDGELREKLQRRALRNMKGDERSQLERRISRS